jgi:ABC-type multidrug transport system fused ATPase/permease subunit
MKAFNGSLSSVIQGWTLFETSLGSIARISSFERDVKPEHRPQETMAPPANWPERGEVEFKDMNATHKYVHWRNHKYTGADHSPVSLPRPYTMSRYISSQDRRSASVAAPDRKCLSLFTRHREVVADFPNRGKSSLLGTPLRLLEIERGQILIDGLDLATIPRDTIRERLITIPQDPLIINASVRLNMDPNLVRMDSDIVGALDRVGLWTLIHERGGLDHDITASSLSNGQRQLLALGRALLKKGHIVLLDEPTSNVDPGTDAIIQQVLREEFAESTVLTVAHRMDTIYPGSDVIVVMDQGRVAEVGPPADLLRQGRLFAQLVRK